MSAPVEERVRETLREGSLPGEAEAAARSWRVVEAALAERAPEGAHRPARPARIALRLALAAALVCIGLVAALTPAGAEVGDWIEERFASSSERAAPAFAGLPPGGPVLAVSRSGAYVVRADGGTRWLGAFSDAEWSPRGLHVVGVRGRRVMAMTPAGTLRWSVARPGRVRHPAWSAGEGFRVAYLEKRTLRVVWGNGEADRLVRRGAAPVRPAWRPGAGHVLAYARPGGGVEVLDSDSGRRLWSRSLPAPRELAWSRDGRRLVSLSARALTVLGPDGRVLRTLPLGGRGVDLALHPGGDRAAVAVTRGGRTRVIEVHLSGERTRQLFQGAVDGLSWSANGRRLLLAWEDADQWLLLGPGGRVRALPGVTAELGAAGGFPRLAGWCCPG